MPKTAYATTTNLFRSGPVHTVVRFALLGGASGAIATTIIHAIHWADLRWVAGFSIGSVKLEISPLTLVPGLMFGLAIGLALRRRGHLSGWRYAAYVAASTTSHFAAVVLAVNIQGAMDDNMFVIGLTAGLLGSACLTALSLPLFPFLRRIAPCLLLLSTGCIFGALLAVSLGGVFLSLLILYAGWQAGYAASLATAITPPETR